MLGGNIRSARTEGPLLDVDRLFSRHWSYRCDIARGPVCGESMLDVIATRRRADQELWRGGGCAADVLQGPIFTWSSTRVSGGDLSADVLPIGSALHRCQVAHPPKCLAHQRALRRFFLCLWSSAGCSLKSSFLRSAIVTSYLITGAMTSADQLTLTAKHHGPGWAQHLQGLEWPSRMPSFQQTEVTSSASVCQGPACFTYRPMLHLLAWPTIEQMQTPSAWPSDLEVPSTLTSCVELSMPAPCWCSVTDRAIERTACMLPASAACEAHIAGI